MLVDMMTNTPINRVPYEKDYHLFVSRMLPTEIAAIKDQLNEMIDGTEINTAGWMPGKNWTGTPFLPIYEKAARTTKRWPPAALASWSGRPSWKGLRRGRQGPLRRMASR